MGNEQNQAYSFGSFGSQGQLRQDTSFGRSRTGYPDGSSTRSFPHTSGSSTMPSPHIQPACEYFPRTPFSTPSAEEQMRHCPSTTPILPQPGQANAWMPASRHNIFNPVEYGSSQAVGHMPTQYPFPMTSRPPMPSIIDSHGFPGFMRSEIAMGEPRHMPLCTGSLGDPHAVPPYQ